jgi:hypothetical protein
MEKGLSLWDCQTLTFFVVVRKVPSDDDSGLGGSCKPRTTRQFACQFWWLLTSGSHRSKSPPFGGGNNKCALVSFGFYSQSP